MQSLSNVAAITRMVLDERQTRAVVVGLTAQMMAGRAHGGQRLATALHTVVGAITAEKIKLYFDRYGVFIGYVAWATVSQDVEKRMMTEQHLEISVQDRDSGDSLWITDCIITGKHLREVLADLRDDLFIDFDEISYFRMKGRRRIAKRVARTSAHGFFHVGARAPKR